MVKQYRKKASIGSDLARRSTVRCTANEVIFIAAGSAEKFILVSFFPWVVEREDLVPEALATHQTVQKIRERESTSTPLGATPRNSCIPARL